MQTFNFLLKLNKQIKLLKPQISDYNIKYFKIYLISRGAFSYVDKTIYVYIQVQALSLKTILHKNMLKKYKYNVQLIYSIKEELFHMSTRRYEFTPLI